MKFDSRLNSLKKFCFAKFYGLDNLNYKLGLCLKWDFYSRIFNFKRSLIGSIPIHLF